MTARMTIRKTGDIEVPVESHSLKVGHFERGAVRVARRLEFGTEGRPPKPYLRLAAARLRRGRIDTDDADVVGELAVRETRKAMDDVGIRGSGQLRESVEAR